MGGERKGKTEIVWRCGESDTTEFGEKSMPLRMWQEAVISQQHWNLPITSWIKIYLWTVGVSYDLETPLDTRVSANDHLSVLGSMPVARVSQCMLTDWMSLLWRLANGRWNYSACINKWYSLYNKKKLQFAIHIYVNESVRIFVQQPRCKITVTQVSCLSWLLKVLSVALL